MFLLVSVRHVGAHSGEHRRGVSIQISVSLGKTFLRISRIRNIPLTWILARVFEYYLLSFPRFWTLSIERFWFLFWSILNGVILKTSNIFFFRYSSGPVTLLAEILAYTKSGLCRSASPAFSFVLPVCWPFVLWKYHPTLRGSYRSPFFNPKAERYVSTDIFLGWFMSCGGKCSSLEPVVVPYFSSIWWMLLGSDTCSADDWLTDLPSPCIAKKAGSITFPR